MSSLKLRRVGIHLSDGEFDISRFGGPFDRIFSTYVLDLLSPLDIEQCLAGAHAAITKGVRFCHAGLTIGTGSISKVTSTLWTLLHRIGPILVDGCRPLKLADHVPANQWEIIHRKVVVSARIPSEVVVMKAR